jgi:cytochrome c biogenesis protein CcdA/thiol-disulfide isomerase/thioredoxin
MALLIAFAFVAGAGTALSPCVLPVLPVVLSAGATGGRRRPLGIVTGLALSFTFATVALVYVIDALGLPSGLPRTLAIIVLIGFGALLLMPPVAARLEARISYLTSRFAPTRTQDRQGFGGGLLIGLALGLVYAPCAGPILAGVITVSASQSFEAGRLAVALAYGIGSAVVLYFLALGGRRVIPRLSRSSGRLQVALGAVMILVGFAMLADLDTRFETAIASDVPSFLVNPTKDLEDSGSVQDQLSDVRGRIGGSGPVAQETDESALRASSLPVIGRAPELVGTQDWFNTPDGRSLSLQGLRGKVVLVDFWPYSCINCIRTLPYLNAWYSRYHPKGFEIVGVHTPEFPFEHSASNVRAAISQDGIHYPVVQDNDYETWSAYGNQYWPAEYLIDAEGRLRLIEFGEGGYAEKERAIRSLLAEAGAGKLGSDAGVRAQAPSAGVTTPETYFGAARAERFINGLITPGAHAFGPLRTPPANHLAYGGRWSVAQESATAGTGAAINLSFHSRRVFVVLGSEGQPRNVRVLLDGKPIRAGEAGDDVRNGSVRVEDHTLYTVVDLPSVQSHLLTLEPQSGVKGYAFTFG